jgi:signal transduction histidine kinase
VSARTGSRLQSRLAAAAGGILVAVIGLLASLAVVYTNADDVGRVADHAAAQQQAEAALGALAAVRATLGQVLLVNPADPQTAAVVIDDSRTLLVDLQTRLDPLGPDFASAAAAVQAAADDYLAQAEAGDLAAAAGLASTALGPALDDLTGQVAVERDRSASAIASARAEMGRLATASRFLVALGIPGVTLLGWLLFTRRRRRRLELAQALERERELNRAKDYLLANISHELRTPLTGIYAAARSMESAGFEDPALATELTEIIVDQSADLNRMIDDLLASARVDAGRLRFEAARVPVADEVRAVAAEFRRSGKPIAVDCAPALVLADPLRLRQVLRNLISNAVRHGGPKVAVVGRPDGHAYLLAVVDDGPGVDPDIEDRLFSRFIHSGNRPLVTGSVGLGLGITRLLAEGMGGSAEYKRREEHTWFIVRLPAAPPAESAVAPQPISASAPSGQGSRVPSRSS